MPVFYRGAGVGTYWHQRDARVHGFVPWNPGGARTADSLLRHIRLGTTFSPYLSLTRSFGVAWSYAMYAGRAVPTPAQPAYVYEINLTAPTPAGVVIVDPLTEVALTLAAPLANISYQHDGLPDFLLGVVNRSSNAHHLHEPIKQPPPGNAVPRPATLSQELETIVNALRDAELIALGAIPQNCVTQRHDVW